MTKKYINNLETKHIELHFDKEEYQQLTAEQKKELKSGYLFSRYITAWVSRSTKNHYNAIRIAEKLGFTEEEKQGEKLSFEEELKIKTEKAERRADKYEYKSEKAGKEAEDLQSSFNSHHGDISFFTQPNINSSSGRAFTRKRERIFNNYKQGFEEYRKSEYFKEKAQNAKDTANMEQFKDPVYLNNRIKECNSIIRKLEKNIVCYEDVIYKKENNQNDKLYDFYQNKSITEIEEYLNETLEKMEYQIDKLAYLTNAMEKLNEQLKELGRKIYSKDDVKVGYLIKIRGKWAKVLKANPKTVRGDYLEEHLKGCYCLYSYAEIQEVKIPEGWTEEANETKNPFKIGDIVTRSNISGNIVLHAYQVIKTTKKTITIQEINIQNNKPIKNNFISDKQKRKTVKQDRQNNSVVNDNGDWYLYKYTV